MHGIIPPPIHPEDQPRDFAREVRDLNLESLILLIATEDVPEGSLAKAIDRIGEDIASLWHDAVMTILQHGAGHRDPTVRETAAVSMGLLMSLDRVEPRERLETLADDDPSPGVREAAKESLEWMEE